MIDEREPRRWSSPDADVPEELRTLLGASRDRAPGVGDVAELRQRLALALGPAAGLGPQTSLLPAAPVASARLQLLGRVAALAGGLGTAALLGLWLSSTPPAVDPGRTNPAPASPPPALTAPPVVESAPPVTAPPSVTTPETAPPGGAVDATPPAAAPRTAHTRRAPAAASSPREAELLRRAQAALAERPEEALRLTAEHQRRFARGALREEREVIAIEALRRLGRNQVAEQRQAEFNRVYRGSVHREKLRDSAR